MKGFLARWVEPESEGAGEPEASMGVQPTEAATTVPSDPKILPAETGTHAMPWAEWKARQLNRVFEEQGVSGKPGRITAETVRHSRKRQTAKEPKERSGTDTERVSAQETTDVLSAEDLHSTEVTREIAGLLAVAYQRYSSVQRVGRNERLRAHPLPASS